MRNTPVWLAALAIAAGTAAHANVTVVSTVTNVGQEYQYSYSVTNNQAASLLLFSISRPDTSGGAASVHDVVAPAGFDADNNALEPTFVNFTANGSGIDPGATLGGFSFISSVLNPNGLADLFDADGNEISGPVNQPLGGPTTSILTPGTVPEPGSLALLAMGGMALLPLRRSRRTSRTA